MNSLPQPAACPPAGAQRVLALLCAVLAGGALCALETARWRLPPAVLGDAPLLPLVALVWLALLPLCGARQPARGARELLLVALLPLVLCAPQLALAARFDACAGAARGALGMQLAALALMLLLLSLASARAGAVGLRAQRQLVAGLVLGFGPSLAAIALGWGGGLEVPAWLTALARLSPLQHAYESAAGAAGSAALACAGCALVALAAFWPTPQESGR